MSSRMIESLRPRFLNLDDFSASQEYPECDDLSETDRTLIQDLRHSVVERLLKRGERASRQYRFDELAEIALVWPDASRSRYSAELEHATSRTTIGAFAGQKVESPSSGRTEQDLRILEYGCCLLELEEPLTIEFYKLAEFPDRVSVAVNGCWRLEMPLHRRQLSWPFAFPLRIDEPSEVRLKGETFGVISNESTWRQWRIAILRVDGVRMPIPLQFGSSASEVFMIALRLITLMPLWSRSMPVNRSRVIDPAVASELSGPDRVVYFIVSLYFVASVYGQRILGQ